MHSPHASPDDLGIHAVFLRRLAQALLRSPDLAEDAVQETLLLAWRKRPEGPHPRGWLVRTLQNVARNMRRSAGRRNRHEGNTPSMAMTAPEAIRAREQLRKELLDAVLALPEGERECILLRYDQGLPARRIAATLGVPAHTVQNRLRRGRVLLRQQLAQTHGASSGDEGAWRAALVALLPPLPSPTGSSGLLGGLLVSKIAWTTAAALLLLGLGLLLLDPWSSSKTDDASPDEQPSVATARSEPDAPALSVPQAPGKAPAAGASSDTPMIHGTVRAAETGTPLPGARVVAFEYVRLRRFETTTDEKGRFAFEETRGSSGAYHVRADLAPHAGAEVVRTTPSRRALDVSLAAGGVLHGTVVVPAGARPTGLRARAVLRRPRGSSGGPVHKLVAATLPAGFAPTVEVPVDPDTGTFELGPLSAGRHAIELRAEGRPPFLVVPPDQPYRWEAGFEVAAGARVDVGEVLLHSDATLRVHLIDAATEETIRRAHFEALTEGDSSLPGTPIAVRTDEQTGMFLVPAQAIDKGRLTLEATVDVPGYARATIDVSGTWGTRPLVLRLHRPSSLLLRVDPSGEETGPMIAFVRRSSDENVLAVQAIDLGVPVEFSDLPTGERLELMVFDAAVDGRRHVASFVLEPGEQRVLEVGGSKRTAVAGRVRQGGIAVGDVLVSVDDAGGTRIRIWTGSDGRFRIDGLAPGPTSVFFNLGEERAMVRRRIEVIEGRVHDASVDLQIEVRGTLRVRPPPGEAPDPAKAGALPDLALVSPGGLVISVRPAEDGSFRTWVPTAAGYTLRSNDTDFYVVAPETFEVKPGTANRVDVEVARDPADGIIEFTIRDAETGTPVPEVTAHYNGPQVSGVSGNQGPGRQVLDDLNLGHYDVRLVAPGYVSGRRRLELTLADRHRTFRVELQRSQAVFVDSFAPGSRGKAAGLQAGDLVRSYGGKAVTSLTTLRAAMQGRAPSELVQVEIRRGSQELTLDIPAGRLGIYGSNAGLGE